MSNVLIRDHFRKRSSRVVTNAEKGQIEESSDQDLLSRAAQGDSDAFDQLYLRYKPRLRKFIGGFVEDDAAADDLLQETFLRVYSNADRYQPSSSFKAWVYKIATNLCLNEIRRKRAHPLVSLNRQVHVGFSESESETVELHELIPDSSFIGPSEAAESAEVLEQILSAISSLSNAHQDVLTLRLWDELNYEQIAQLLKCSVGTAKSRAFYGLRALRDKLESDDDASA